MALEAAKLARGETLEHPNRLFLFEVGLSVQVSRLDVTLVLMGFQDDEVGGHELISQDFDDLANPEVLPLSGLEHAFSHICCQHFPCVLRLVLLEAFAILKEVLQRRGNDHDD